MACCLSHLLGIKLEDLGEHDGSCTTSWDATEPARGRTVGILDTARRLKDKHMGNMRANYPRELAVSEPQHETIEFIKRTECRSIAELGVYEGHTSLEFAKFLNGEGELHLFDYEDRVKDVANTLTLAGFCNFRTFGSSYRLLDSYNWSLARLLQENKIPIYDYVFLDGAHTWAVDALTALLADSLLKTGGYLDLDDYYWTLEASPSLNPKAFPLTRKLYTDEQMATQQVKMIVDLVIRRTGRYRELVPNKIFQKTA
jgi:predicted O-methyltransferase YrrM